VWNVVENIDCPGGHVTSSWRLWNIRTARIFRVKGGISKVVGHNSPPRNRKLPPLCVFNRPIRFFFYTSGKTTLLLLYTRTSVLKVASNVLNKFGGKRWRADFLTRDEWSVIQDSGDKTQEIYVWAALLNIHCSWAVHNNW